MAPSRSQYARSTGSPYLRLTMGYSHGRSSFCASTACATSVGDGYASVCVCECHTAMISSPRPFASSVARTRSRPPTRYTRAECAAFSQGYTAVTSPVGSSSASGPASRPHASSGKPSKQCATTCSYCARVSRSGGEPRSDGTAAHGTVPPMSRRGDQVVATNRRARHDYHILESWECGLVLHGSEVKSLRDGHVTIRDAYARVE